MEQNNNYIKAKRRPRHPRYAENRRRIKMMLTSTYGPAFMQDNYPCGNVVTAAGKVMFRNPVDYDALDRKKWELSLTNADLLELMRSLSNGSDGMTAATLSRKLMGEVDFASGEILLLAKIFDLTDEEILNIFRLRPKRQGENAESF